MSTTSNVEYLAVLKASYDYKPTSDDEVEIKEDGLLFLLERTDEDWWKVRVKVDTDNPPEGLVPASYVEEAEPIYTVKALYDYDASAEGELTIKEDEILRVYAKEDEWLLVRSNTEDGKAGYVPENYCEEYSEGKTGGTGFTPVIVPGSPPRPKSAEYVDPGERVAATAGKAKADDIQTWSVSEVDKKGKKKKGTLGVGNGAIFFASESDKTPVQKWQTSDISSVHLEKGKHINLEIGGSSPTSLHFTSKDAAEAIVKKIESSRALSEPSSSSSSSRPRESVDSRATTSPTNARPTDLSISTSVEPKPNKNGASVHWAPSPASVIPPREEEDDEEGEMAVAQYDFTADGDDELTVQENERLLVIDRVSSDEWWKCRNEQGKEGVVPASYLELESAPHDDSDSLRARQEREQEEAEAEAQREQEEREEAEAREREREKAEAQRKAKAAAEEAKREQEKRDREAKAKAKKEQEERQRRQEAEAKAEEEAAAEAEAQAEAEAEEARQAEEARLRAEKAAQARRAKAAAAASKPQPDKTRTSSERPKPEPGKTRIWHDRTGQFQVEAQFLGFERGKIRLHKINGVIIEVPSEKMSPEDMAYIDRVMKKKSGDDDNVPLANLAAQKRQSSRPNPSPKKSVDWFDFFLTAGCDMDDCTRYASAFERDKMDEGILPLIKPDTLRSLGLREGDIIRVMKVIEDKGWASKPRPDDTEQVRRDAEYARQLQEAEYNGQAPPPPPPSSAPRRTNTTSPAPNLFSGPGGALKNNTSQRRGRPPPSANRAASGMVDVNSIAAASDQITRTGSPRVGSPAIVTSSPVSTTGQQPPARTGSALASGFDDDAWTVRPSSTKPSVSPKPTTTAAPPAPTPPPAPAPPPAPTPPSAPAPSAQSPPRAASTNPAPTPQQSAEFELLAKIGQMKRPPSAPAPAVTSPLSGLPTPPVPSPPVGYHSGMGMGSSPTPLGQLLTQQQTGLLGQNNGVRGPLAPVPSNQGLLNPLIPTNIHFTGFVPTRAPAMTGNNALQPGAPSPSFGGFGPIQPMGQLGQQPTGLPATNQAFPNFGGVSSHITGFNPTQQATPPFGQQSLQPSPVSSVFNQGVQQTPPPFNSSFSAPHASSPAPANNSPASIFASMKQGTFATGENSSQPQSADKYDALRQANPLISQPTGWIPGMNNMNGGVNGFPQQYSNFQPR